MKTPSLIFSMLRFLAILIFAFSTPYSLLAQNAVDPWSEEEEDYLDEEESIDEEGGDLTDEEEGVEEPPVEEGEIGEPPIEEEEEIVPPPGKAPSAQQPVVPPKKKKPATAGEISITPPAGSKPQVTRPPAQPPVPPAPMSTAPLRPTPAPPQPSAAPPQLRFEEKKEEIESEPEPSPLFPTDEILLEAVEEEDDEADLFQSDIGRELEEKRIAKLPPVEEELKEEPVPEPVPAKVIRPKEEKKETVRKEAPTGKEAVELEEGVKQRGDKIVEIYEPWRIESPQHFAFQFKFAPYYPSKFKGADGHFQGIFDGGTGAWNEISLEWQPVDLFGILGIKGGTGYYVLVSHEKVDQKRLANSPILNFIPVQGALAYHLAYWHDQWVVPFGEVGGGFYYIFQNFARSPSKGKNYAAWKSGSYWGGGVQLLLDIFESDTAHVFDVDYGVNNSYLTLEYRRIEAREKKEYDFSGEFFMIGLHFDF